MSDIRSLQDAPRWSPALEDIWRERQREVAAWWVLYFVTDADNKGAPVTGTMTKSGPIQSESVDGLALITEI